MNKLTSISILTAISASLCCITPLLAIFASSAGLAASFQWLEPLRPWLIGTTVLILGYSWFQVLKPAKKDDCSCEVATPNFLQSKSFLSLVTVFALLMLSFHSYAHLFYPNQQKEQKTLWKDSHISNVEFEVIGMTCGGCEAHIEHAVHELEGIFEVKASFQDANTIVKFDSSTTNLEAVLTAIKSTNYAVGNHKRLSQH